MNLIRFVSSFLVLVFLAPASYSAFAAPHAPQFPTRAPHAPTVLTFTVNSSADEADANPGNGKCASTPSKKCTLRAAIMENNALGGGNTIVLPAGAYLLAINGVNEDASATGDLDILHSVNLQGSHAPTTIVDAQGVDRVLDVRAGSAVISGVTIRGGYLVNDYGGGIAIQSGAKAKLRNSILTNNHSTVEGGAIENLGKLTIVQSTLGPYNSATNGGGGIGNSGILKLVRTRLTENHVVGVVPNRIGGAVLNVGSSVVILQSTLDNNRADHGAGLYNAGGGSVTMVNSTVANNHYDSTSSNASDGAGIYNYQAQLNLYNVTLADNISGLNAQTGGLYNAGGANAYNSILDRNLVLVNPNLQIYAAADCYGPLSGILNVKFYNLIYAPVNCNYGPDPSVQTNVHANLGALQNNGGFTPTEALLASSPAIDTGNPKGCKDSNGNVLPNDQRNAPRPTDGDGNGKARCDRGAYEYP
ncbi:MAG: CSLREA domain-containing protein [Chloroflexi bacterium]|nr:CSLREA domain-containing protein [Chloroflexota bacterium]